MKRNRIFTIIQIGNREDIPSRAYDIFLMIAVILNFAIAIFDTFPKAVQFHEMIVAVEIITVVIFLLDYVLRIVTADYLYPKKSAGEARLLFMVSWSGIIDFLSCIPYFLFHGASILRIFRVIRILRVFRIRFYSDPLKTIGDVLHKKRDQLISSCFIVFVMICAASIMMYNLEHRAQPEAFANAFSGLWWAVSTLLTVGYGDIVPITVAGKICGSILTFLGVGLVAIPTGILSAGFIEQMNEGNGNAELIKENINECCSENNNLDEYKYNYCPHCGEKLPK